MSKLLSIFKKQRSTFIRNAEGEKIIHAPIIYNMYEDMAHDEQVKIGKSNKNIIIAECKKRKIPLPKFNKEGIKK